MSSSLLKWMEDIYTKIKTQDLEWKDFYPNRMKENGKRGIYAEFIHDNEDGTWTYIKYSIRYHYRVDNRGCSHPDEGVKYYVLAKIENKDLKEDPYKYSAANYHYASDGNFIDVFEDEETAKAVAMVHLKVLLYPFTFILSDEEGEEWNKFIESFKN